MSATICPTVTVDDEAKYAAHLGLITIFSGRIHIDLADGKFTPNKLIAIDEIWWPADVTVDLHVMYKKPMDFLKQLMVLGPELIIVHAEADVKLKELSKILHSHGIEVGVALLRDTPVEKIQSDLNYIDHVLVFAGNLGFYGGYADLSLLEKVKALKFLRPSLEIGWDGGINDNNVKQLVDGGVDVLNVGGFIANSDDPEAAYVKLKTLAG